MKALVLLAVITTGFGTRVDDHWPPVRYRHVGTATVTFVRSQSELDKLCGPARHGMVTEACTTGRGLIILPDPCGFAGELARIECHENAHRFGNWPGDHPA